MEALVLGARFVGICGRAFTGWSLKHQLTLVIDWRQLTQSNSLSFNIKGLPTLCQMKPELFFAPFCMICASVNAFAGGHQPTRIEVADTNSYHLAYVYVKDDGHNYAVGREPGIDASFVRGIISGQLEVMGIERTFSDDPDTDLRVICQFEHGTRGPVVTPGFEVKTTFINKCTLKIADKKTGGILVENAYVWKKNSGEAEDFIKSVFAEWKAEREKGAPARAQPGSGTKMTNGVPLRTPQNTPSNSVKAIPRE
jgi:hypothetical protein